MDQQTLTFASIAMIVVGVGFIFLISKRKNESGRSPMEWFGYGLSTLLILFAGVMLMLGFTVGDTVRGPFSDQRSSVGHEAPSFSFTLLSNDESKSLADYKGEVILLNFWLRGARRVSMKCLI